MTHGTRWIASVCLLIGGSAAAQSLEPDPAWTGQGDQVDAFYGHAAACAGDVDGDGFTDVIVGALFHDGGQLDEGRAYLYLGSADGLGSTPAWIAESDQAGAYFGQSVACAGDVNGDGFADVIVGAHAWDGAFVDCGAAFVYCGSAAGLSPSPSWSATGQSANDYFGIAVASAGDVDGDGCSDVAIGASGVDAGPTLTDAGAVYVFKGSSGGLGATPWGSCTSGYDGGRLGSAVASAGDVQADGFADLMAGAPEAVVTGSNPNGSAFVFPGDATGVTFTRSWFFHGGQDGAAFGRSVASAGDVNGDGCSDVLVGAPLFDGGQPDEGRAFLYQGGPGGPPSLPAWTWEWDQAGAQTGNRVATAGDVDGDGRADVVIASWQYDDGQTNEGRVDLFLGGAAGLHGSPAWSEHGEQSLAQFGSAAGSAGDVDGDGYADLVIGAVTYDAGQSDEGKAFVYLSRGPALPATTPAWSATGADASRSGFSVAFAGDVDGDGFGDALVGAPQFNNAFANTGRAQLYRGTADGLGAAPAWSIEGGKNDAELGRCVAGAGDVNGDGLADVLVPDIGYANGQVYEGRVRLFLGTPTGLAAVAAWSVEGDSGTALLGWSVSSAGDVDGDGRLDVVVGAPGVSAALPSCGRVLLYRGSSAGLEAQPAWTRDGAQSTGTFGSAVACAGDVNADGFSDVMIGASNESNGESDEGRVYVHLGSGSGPEATAVWIGEGNSASAFFGWAVGSAGDVDGDGFSDVLVGAPGVDATLIDLGLAAIYRGTAAGVAASPHWSAIGTQDSAKFGFSVAGGDVDGDGLSDAIVGAFGATGPFIGTGSVTIHRGSAGGEVPSQDWQAFGSEPVAAYGWSVAGGGDANGDGYGDVLVGAPLVNGPGSDAGRSYLHLGNGGGARTLKPRQRRSDDSAPIAPLAKTATGSFLARALATSPFGTGRARLDVEVKPLGVAFDGTGVASSAVAAIGLAAADVAVVVSSLAPDTPHHWRARFRHDPSTSPLLPATRWFSPPGNTATETDFRTSRCGDAPASALSYGTGKAGTLGVPSLASAVAPSVGGTCDLAISGGLPGAGPSFVLMGFAPAALPFDKGTLLVLPFTTLMLPALGGGGALALPVPLPDDAALCGLSVYFQAGFVDPGATGPYHTALTPGLKWTFGS